MNTATESQTPTVESHSAPGKYTSVSGRTYWSTSSVSQKLKRLGGGSVWAAGEVLSLRRNPSQSSRASETVKANKPSRIAKA